MVVSPRVVPTRRTYAWLAVAAMAFAIYVSLIPFRLRGLPFWPALHTFAIVISTPEVGRVSRTNFLANLLLFIPIGFTLIGTLLVDRRPRVLQSVAAAGTTLLSGLAVSLTAEFLQMFAPGRVPARADVNAQTVGCLAGIAAWLAIGPALTLWLRGAQTRSASDRLSKALAGYAAVWTIANLAPFDVTVDLGELSQRFHSGLITLVPFGSTPRPTSRVAWDVLIAVVSAVPLGVLGLAGWTRAGRLRPAPAAFCLGAAFVAGMEVAQIFVASHAADITDVIFGCVGVAIGVLAGVRVLVARRPDAAAEPGRRWSWVLLTAWCLVLFVYHWMPYDFSLDGGMIRGKLAGLSFAPFAGYAGGSDLNALNDILVKLGLSVPLGAISAFLSPGRERGAHETTMVLAAATVLFSVIEAGQVFIPSRSPDPSDVFLGVAGTIGGLWLGRWLRGDQ